MRAQLDPERGGQGACIKPNAHYGAIIPTLNDENFAHQIGGRLQQGRLHAV